MSRKLSKEKLRTSLKAVQRYLRPHRSKLVILSLLGIVSAAANGIVPFITGLLFDAILSPQRIELIGYYVPHFAVILFFWFGIQIIASITDWRISRRSEVLGINLFTDYMVESYCHLLELPMSFHKKHKTGEYTNKLWRTANALETIAGQILSQLAPQFLSIIVALIVAYLINPLLASVMLVGVLVYILTMTTTVPPLIDLEIKVHDAFGKAFGDSYDAVANVAAVKQAVAEEHERKKINRIFRTRAMQLWLKMSWIWKDLNFYQRLAVLGTQLAIFILSIIAIYNGTMTVGELVMFNAYAAILFGPFVMLGHQWQVVQNGFIALEKSERIFSSPAEIYTPEKAVELKGIRGDIDFKNVSYWYNSGKAVLENINFTVKAGEVVALVGESGVGKSTLLDLISGYNLPKKGQVLIDNHDIRKIDLRFLRSQIAIVPQEVILFNDTIENNIKYGNFEASRAQVMAAARKAHAFTFIEKFQNKWKQLVGERGVKLSVGQKQRVSIARAILRNPRILILDEPTSALDAKSERIIQESLEELMRDRTTFIIAHRLSTVRKADRILVIEDGKIIETGTHHDLVERENGVYRRLYELQIGLHA